MHAAIAAHLEVMMHARESGELRTIRGRAYPIAEGALQAWEAGERERRRERAIRLLRRIGPRHEAERAFA